MKENIETNKANKEDHRDAQIEQLKAQVRDVTLVCAEQREKIKEYKIIIKAMEFALGRELPGV